MPGKYNENQTGVDSRPGAVTGFTLMETLIALVLFSLILVMLYGSLYSAGHSWRASEIHTMKNDDKRLVVSFMRRLLEQTAPVLLTGAGEQRVLFNGNNSSLHFVSRLPAHHAGSGLHFLQLKMRGDELALIYLPLIRYKTRLHENSFPGSVNEISLIKHIRTINLDYFGRDNEESPMTWRNHWNNSERLPDLLRLRIITDQAAQWPELVIALRAQVSHGQPQLTLNSEEDNFGA